MQAEFIIDIIKHIQEKAKCNVDFVEDEKKKEIIFNIKPKGMPVHSDYLISFFDPDGAGTSGIKIRWTVGKVTNYSEVWKSLILNENTYLNQGPLFTAIIPKGDDGIFSLVGQMIFPSGSSAEEIVRLWFNQAYINYIMFPLSAPGVTMF